MRLRGSYSCASSLPNGRMCIRYFCLSTSSVRSAIGMRSATLSGGVQMTAIYHPAALLRDESKRPDTFLDLKSIQTKVRELCEHTEC